MHFVQILIISTALATLVGCQTMTAKPATPTPTTTTPDETPLSFNITGKIGVTTVSETGTQAGSAFYAWGQTGERFAIDLTGALGLGATSIRFDGKQATLVSDQTGELTADSPEALLKKATGWQAPISELPYWIMGKPSDNDTSPLYDNNRLTQTQNGDWTAKFDYPASTALPNRLRITHTDGHRVVLTINHQ